MLVLSGGALFACEFPNYAFQRSEVGASGDDGGTSGASVGGSAVSAGASGTHDSGGTSSGAAGTGNGSAGAANGGLLFSDDFESAQATQFTANAIGNWSTATMSSNHVYEQTAKVADLSVVFAGSSAWTDQVLEVKVNVLTFGGSSSSDVALLGVRFKDADNFYYAALRSDGKVVLKARLNGNDSSLGPSVSAGITPNTWYDVKVTAVGETLSVSVGGTLLQTVNGVLISSGAIALGTSNTTAAFDDVSVKLP